jgi:hypothetical protein
VKNPTFWKSRVFGSTSLIEFSRMAEVDFAVAQLYLGHEGWFRQLNRQPEFKSILVSNVAIACTRYEGKFGV